MNLLFKIIFTILVLTVFAFNANSQTETEKQLQTGMNYLQTQDYSSALQTFHNILQEDAENDSARRGLALSLVGLDKFPEASREIAKLLRNSPNDVGLLELLGRTFWQQKRYMEAEIVIKRRLQLADVSAENWAFYGDVLDAQKETRRAIGAYKIAVELKPDSIDYRYALGALYWKIVLYDEAENEFLEILKLQPEEPRASFNLGDIYLNRGEIKKAIRFLETSVKNFPNEYDTHFALGRAYLKNGDFEKAVEELKSAVEIRSEIAEGFYQLGLALQKFGKRDEAKTAFEKAKELQKAKLESEKLLPEKEKEP